jgi:hypothetical protein
MAMVRRWAIFRVGEEFIVQVGARPSKGLAAVEAMTLARATGIPHHIAEQIMSRHAAIEQYGRPPTLRRIEQTLPEGA